MKRTPVLTAAAAAIALAGAAIAAGGGGAQEPAGRSFTVFEREGGFGFVDNKPTQRGKNDQRISVGDQFAFNSALLDEAKKRVGRLDATCIATGAGRTFAGGQYVCHGTFRLADGHLALSTAFRGNTSDNAAIAITGGTGAYEGARGSVLSKQEGKLTRDTVHLLP
jgi:allene oxide cyclase-like protein